MKGSHPRANVPPLSSTQSSTHDSLEMLERAFINRLAPTAYVLPGLEERRIESNGAPETAEALASLAWKGLLKRAGDRQRSIVRQLVRARIAQEGLDQLEQCRSLGWASSHDPAPILIGQHRKVLHGLHVSPAHQRFLCERNPDLLSRARFGPDQGSAIVRQIPRASHRVRGDRHYRDDNEPDQNQSSSHFCLPNRPRNSRALLTQIVRRYRLQKLDCVIGEGKAAFQAVQSLDLEGIVAKRMTDAYEPGKTRWWKVLNRGYSQKEGRAELFERRYG